MQNFFSELNKDQLDGLAQLCFDIAKAAFAFIFVPLSTIEKSPVITFVRVLIILIAGLAFTYTALLLLKEKEKI